MAHGLFTEAVTRFTKKQSPAQLPYVLAQAMQMAAELGGATQASAVIDNNAANYSSPVITTSAEFINSRLGTELSSQEIAKILSNVEFKVELGDQIEVTVPFWRTDIKVSEDLVEEVGRLHGYDKLPSVLPSRTLSPVGPSPMLEFKQNLRTTLSLMGANEVLTYSFVHGDLLAKVGQKPEMAFKLTNAISPELQYYRLSLTPSLLQLVHPNVKAGHNQFALFELGKAHQKGQSEKADEPLEQNKLALVVAAKSNKAAAYYQARTYLDAMVARIGVTLDYHKMTEQDTLQPSAAPYEPSRSALVCCSDNVIGVIGEFSMNVIQNLKLPSFCAGFEIDTEKLLAATKEKGQKYTPIPRYPSIAQDMCLEVGAEVAFSEVRSALVTALNKVTQVNELATQTLIDIFVDPNRPEVKRITFRLTFSSYERTLQESYVNELMDDVFSEISQQLNATRI